MIYIHIGPHKTGSTAIQAFLLAHEETLAEHGVIYPAIGRAHGGGHYGLKAEVRDRHSPLPGWTALAYMDESTPNAKIVVSCEGFEYFSPKQIGRVAERLRGRPVTVIGYFREYAGLIQSQYLQLSRICRNVNDFDAFFDTYLDDNERAFERFERWAQGFGWAHVQVRHFDRAHLVGGDVVEDFLRALGLSRVQLKVEGASERNLAPPWQAVEVMREVFREFGRIGGTENDAWMDAMRKQVRMACESAVPPAGQSAAKVDYVSSTQRARCNALTQQDIDDFNRQLPAPGCLPALKLSEDGRAFLPSVAQVAPEVVASAMARVTLALLAAANDPKREERVRRKQERAASENAATDSRERKRQKVARSIAQASGL